MACQQIEQREHRQRVWSGLTVPHSHGYPFCGFPTYFRAVYFPHSTLTQDHMDSTLVYLKRTLLGEKLEFSLLDFGLKFIAAILVLMIGILLIKLVMSVATSALKRTVQDPTVRRYVSSAARILLWVILILVLLGVFGIETTSLVTVLGAAGLAIGLALQGSLSNFAAGFMLLMFRPFKAGDEVEVSGVTGTVIEIGIFSTIIDMPDNVRAFVPNSTIFSGVIRNRSVHEYVRIELTVTVGEDVEITRAQQLIQRLFITNDQILEIPRPDVQVEQGDSSGVKLAIHCYARLRDAVAVRTSLIKQIREQLRAEEIKVLKG